MIKLTIFIAIIALQVGCSKQTSKNSQANKPEKDNAIFTPEVIYGEDNRLDLYQVSNSKLHQISRSTVALVNSQRLTLNDVGEYELNATNYGQRYGLCSDEAFYSQSNAAFCSGFLVQEDIIVTAGHCVQHQPDCENTKFLFDFGYYKSDQQLERFQKEQVYSCKEIITTYQRAGDADYAVIKLDRPVRSRVPLELALQDELKVEDEVFVIGHPSGLPTKYAPNATVRRLGEKYFIASLDTYGGNSGSAVFNTNTNKVEGILVRGEMDFVFDPSGCRRSKRCDDSGCRGEDVTNIQVVKSFLPDNEVQKPTPQIYTYNSAVKIKDHETNNLSVKAFDVTNLNRQVYVEVDIDHTYIGDLTLTLHSPNNMTYTLHNKNGYAADFIKGVYGRTLVPIDSLSRLRPQVGDWMLQIKDHHTGDSGTLNSWSLIFE